MTTDPVIPDPADSVPEESTGSGRFALYDKTMIRFVGHVHDTRKGAEADKPDKAERGRFEVREV